MAPLVMAALRHFAVPNVTLDASGNLFGTTEYSHLSVPAARCLNFLRNRPTEPGRANGGRGRLFVLSIGSLLVRRQ
jgi:hypothetical protein